MKIVARTVLLGLAIASLGACATTPETAYTPAAKGSQATIDNDYEYMAAVEQIARRRGIEVQWVNPPVKRVKPDQQ